MAELKYDHDVPKDLSIIADGSTFRVVDGRNTHYGPVVSTREEAEQLLHDWNAYYTEPLNAAR